MFDFIARVWFSPHPAFGALPSGHKCSSLCTLRLFVALRHSYKFLPLWRHTSLRLKISKKKAFSLNFCCCLPLFLNLNEASWWRLGSSRNCVNTKITRIFYHWVHGLGNIRFNLLHSVVINSLIANELWRPANERDYFWCFERNLAVSMTTTGLVVATTKWR